MNSRGEIVYSLSAIQWQRFQCPEILQFPNFYLQLFFIIVLHCVLKDQSQFYLRSPHHPTHLLHPEEGNHQDRWGIKYLFYPVFYLFAPVNLNVTLGAYHSFCLILLRIVYDLLIRFRLWKTHLFFFSALQPTTDVPQSFLYNYDRLVEF